jgi:hypothetical protein
LGRYLYDLDGNWVDLDERKQPLSRPRLPDWALPKRKTDGTTCRNGNAHAGTNGHMEHKNAAPVDLAALKARVKSLCEQVGLGLARSVTKAIAATEDPAQILDAAVLSALSARLEDTLRGVERLRRSTGVVGQASLSRLCQQMNLAGDCLDDIPDRSALRQLIEALEKAAGATPLRQNGAGAGLAAQAVGNGHTATDATNGHGNGRNSALAKRPVREGAKGLGTARADLVREAQRVGKLRNMKVADVVDRAAKGAFRFTDLQRLTVEALPALKAAVEILRQVA